MRILTALLFLLSAPALAWQSPDEALAKFLAFELGGGRLQQWEFGKYLAVSKEYDEPGWDQVVLVTGYKASPMACKADLCSARVMFQLAATEGLNNEQLMPFPKGGSQAVTFYAVQHAGQWLLGPFKEPPHILASSLAGRR